MFKVLKNRKGQNSFVEYAVTFFLVVAVVSAMTVYFRRVVQARVRDSAYAMAMIVNNAYTGSFTYQYEPYYSDADVYRQTDNIDTKKQFATLPFPAEISRLELNDRTTTQSTTGQTSPRFAK